MADNVSNLRTPTEIRFGNHSSRSIVDLAVELGCSHALIITTPELIQNERILDILTGFKNNNLAISIFSGVTSEPSLASVKGILPTAQESGCDLVVGIGGGSVLDSAKAIAVIMTNEGNIEDLLGQDRVEKRGLPTILAPTTSGTGAEVTQNALLFDDKDQTKKAIISPRIIPNIAVIDPTLTLSLPSDLTASTGFDALCHAIECYTSKNASAFSDIFALQAIRLISTHLRTAVYHGASLKAREGMAMASLLAGLSIVTAGTTAVHALAYPLQEIGHVAHGVANAVLLPYVMDFNIAGDVNRFIQVAQALGQPMAHLASREAAQKGVDMVRALSKDVNIPQHLSEIGIKVEQVPDLVKGALEVKRLLNNNPRKLDDEDAKMIYLNAM